jgi:RND family efflux transporter MFP subunit
VLYYVDPMHPAYKSDKPGIAPDCGMKLEPVYADVENQSPSALLAKLPPGTVSVNGDMQRLLGIRIAAVEKSGATRDVRVLGRVVAEDTRIYRINSGMEGFVRETYNDSVGMLVKKDQRLATCYGPDSLSVASGFLAATASIPGAVGRDGNRTMPFPGAVSKQGVSSLQGYTDRLRNLGMSDVQIKQMTESRQLPDGVDIVAPVDGFILARNITPGQHFDRAMEFYQIADLSRVWIIAEIFENEAQYFRPGAMARVTLQGQQRTFSARISNVLPDVDPATHTLKLRLEADNPGFALRADMFVDVELPVRLPAGLSVPADALIDSGLKRRVFVESAPGMFEQREVETGWRFGDRIQIVRGLSAGERVVSAGTFLVDSESKFEATAAGRQATSPAVRKASEGSTAKLRATALESKPGAAPAGMVRDPKCGMEVDASKAAAEGHTLKYLGRTYSFCSNQCREEFQHSPEKYLHSPGEMAGARQ